MLLWWLALAFVTGAAIPLAVPLPVGAISVAAGGAIALKRRTLGLAVAAFGLALLRLALPAPHDALAPYLHRQVALRGIVAGEPDIRDTGANYDVRVTAIQTGRLRTIAGMVAVHTSPGVLLRYGDLVSLRGQLEPIAAPYRSALAHQGITASLSYPRVLSQGNQTQAVTSGLVVLRERTEAGIRSWMPEPEAALLVGITLGTHSGDLGNLAPLLVLTGLIHIIAISGIKVAIVAGTVHALARRLPGREPALAASVLAIWGYVALTGFTVSGERSAVMWTLVFIAGYLGRNTVALVSLGLTAALMVAVQPALLWDPGFQMSTLGTFGIVAFTNPFLRALNRIPSPFRESLAVTIAAQLATLPVVLASFHVVPLLAPITNALVLPLLPFLIVGGFLLGIIAPIAVLAAPLGAVLSAMLEAVLVLVHMLAGVGVAAHLLVLDPALAAAYYAAAGAAAWLTLRRIGWAPPARRPEPVRELALGVVAALALTLAPVIGAQGAGAPALIRIGVGDGWLLRVGPHLVLIDGAKQPYRYLERLGQLTGTGRVIDAIVVTDPRATHIAALAAVAARYRVGEVLDVGSQYPSATYARWRAELRARHIRSYSLRTGARLLVGSATLTALGPDALYPNPRDCTGLLRLEDGRRRIVLIGAASRREQLEALFRPVDLHASILVADTTKPVLPAFRRRVGGTLWPESAARPSAVRSISLP